MVAEQSWSSANIKQEAECSLGRLPVNNITKQPLALTSLPTAHEKYRIPHQANLVTEKKKNYLQQH